ncbi:MAG: hypothetical protein Q7R70_01785 [Candidatus Diapherotrites archaeon]|nr:hypothetical protein [Candidatus Diapherotrites archaeon]
MNSKGQLSFDLIFAVLLFLTATQIILSMTQGFEESQKQIAAQNQLRGISESFASKISQTSLLPNSEVNFQTPYIMLAGSGLNDCNIQMSKKEEPLHSVEVSVEVLYSVYTGSVSKEELVSYCVQNGWLPKIKVTAGKGASQVFDSKTFDLDFVDGVQKKIAMLNLSQATWIELEFLGDCAGGPPNLGGNASTDLSLKKMIVTGVIYDLGNYYMPCSGAGHAGCPGLLQVSLSSQPNCNSSNGLYSCRANQTCPGDWIASNSDRCCNTTCSDSGEVQADYISAGTVSKRASVSVPLKVSDELVDGIGNPVSGFSFSCGSKVTCVQGASGISCIKG